MIKIRKISAIPTRRLSFVVKYVYPQKKEHAMDLNRYFHPEHQIFLENVNYEVGNPTSGKMKMNCKDTIVARVIDPVGVKFTFNRAITFEPQGPFYLSVSFSVIMRWREEVKDEVDWRHTDLANEFRSSGGVVLHNLASRAALLIAEITSSSGQSPIITLPGSPRRSKEESEN